MTSTIAKWLNLTPLIIDRELPKNVSLFNPVNLIIFEITVEQFFIAYC